MAPIRSVPACSTEVYYPETFVNAFARNEIRAEAVYAGCSTVQGQIAHIETRLVYGARFDLYAHSPRRLNNPGFNDVDGKPPGLA